MLPVAVLITLDMRTSNRLPVKRRAVVIRAGRGDRGPGRTFEKGIRESDPSRDYDIRVIEADERPHPANNMDRAVVGDVVATFKVVRRTISCAGPRRTRLSA
jgi:hypothetical protein